MLCSSNPAQKMLAALLCGLLLQGSSAFRMPTPTVSLVPKSKIMPSSLVTIPSIQAPPAKIQMGASPTAAVGFVKDRLPGMGITYGIATAAAYLAKTTFDGAFSPLLYAAILGMVYGNTVGIKAEKLVKWTKTGIAFSKARLLRLGIILYGFKITFQQVANVGPAGLIVDLMVMTTTALLGWFFGTKVLGIDEETTLLCTTGATICGCSAVLAAEPVVGGESYKVSVAVATVVLCGTISMFTYPLMHNWLPITGKVMGIYTGATVHELAGVVAAGASMGGIIETTAVITKLTRVLMLAPFLVIVSALRSMKGAGGSKKLVVPWFAVGFVAVSVLNSLFPAPGVVIKAAAKYSGLALAMAMAGLGIDSNIQKMKGVGIKPVILASVLFAHLMFNGYWFTRAVTGLIPM